MAGISFLLLFFSAMVFADARGPIRTLDELLAEAQARKLHEDRYWHILLHYRPVRFGVKSLIDDPAFFLAQKGQTDPEAELKADIRVLFGERNEEESLGCRFMARYHWLRETLHPDPDAFPMRSCPEMERIDPRSAVLVFPTYFLNNPASMFGHTLIHIKTDYQSDLMSNAVNYAAFAPETRGFVFAFRGIFGHYKGYYSILPYYKKLQEYGDLNQRDIWEYELNLIPEELKRMVRHIRELESIYSFYYFFDENCSYNLLFLLEAARPSLHLTDRFSFVTIPIDTVKLLKEQGAVKSVRYRPSKATLVRHRASLLSDRQLDLAGDLIHGRIPLQNLVDSDLSIDEQIQVLDTVIEFIRFRYYKRKMDIGDYQKRLIEALNARSRMGRASIQLPRILEPPRPDESRPMTKFSLGFGHGKAGPYWEIGFRPLLTDLLDSDYASGDGIQIELLDVRLRNGPQDRRLRLDHLDLFDVASILPADRLLTPWSWQASGGMVRRLMTDGYGALTGRVQLGLGRAMDTPVLGLPYAMLGVRGETGGRLKQNVSIAPVLTIGTMARTIRDWKCHLEFRSAFLGMEGGYAYHEAAATQHVSLSRESSLCIGLEWEQLGDAEDLRLNVSWDLFF